MKKITILLWLCLTLCACSGNDPSAQITISGTASQGAPLSGKACLKDATGAEITTDIGTNGAFTFAADGMTAPFLLRAGGLYSFADNSGTVNINPLTDMAVRYASGSADLAALYDGSSAVLAPELVSIRTKILSVVDSINASMDPIYQMYGITAAAQKDFMKGNISIGQGVDAIFDVVKLNVAADGSIAMTTRVTGAPVLVASRDSATGAVKFQLEAYYYANMLSAALIYGGGGIPVSAPQMQSIYTASPQFSVIDDLGNKTVISTSNLDEALGIYLSQLPNTAADPSAVDLSYLRSPSATQELPGAKAIVVSLAGADTDKIGYIKATIVLPQGATVVANSDTINRLTALYPNESSLPFGLSEGLKIDASGALSRTIDIVVFKGTKPLSIGSVFKMTCNIAQGTTVSASDFSYVDLSVYGANYTDRLNGSLSFDVQ